MKQRLLFTLALCLIFALAACGGKDPAPVATPNTAPLIRTDVTPTPAAQPKPEDIDIGAIVSGNGSPDLISGMDPLTRQQYIDAANEDGYDVSFGIDGSTTLEHRETGERIIQKPGGIWEFTDADGSGTKLQMGGDWPDNDFTAQVSRPQFAVGMAAVDGEEFSVTFVDASLDDMKAYVKELEALGFSGEVLEMGGIYSFEATNKAGYTVGIFSMNGQSGMSIMKP